MNFFDWLMPKKMFEGLYSDATADGWNPRGSAPTASPAEIHGLSSRVDDLLKNDPYTEGAIKALESGIVGPGVKPRCISKSGNKQLSRLVDQYIKQYFETMECDASQNQNLYGMQKTVVRALIKGNCFIRKRSRPMSMGLTIPFQFQVLSYDYLATDYYTDLGNNQIVDGIEYNRRGAPVAYYFYKSNPSERYSFIFNSKPVSTEVIRVPARDVYHLFDKKEVDQRLGYTWFAPVISMLRMTDSYRKNVLTKQQMQSSITAFITSDETDDVNEVFGKKETNANGDVVSMIKRGQLNRLIPGESVEFPSLPDLGSDTQFYKQFIRAIAVGLGLSYEGFSRDFSEVNYSSARMGWIAEYRILKAWQQNIVFSQWLNRLGKDFLDGLVIQGAISSVQRDDLSMKWSFARREMLDPVKETNAMLAQIDGKIKSRVEVIEENGGDYVDVMEEIAFDSQTQESLGIADPIEQAPFMPVVEEEEEEEEEEESEVSENE